MHDAAPAGGGCFGETAKLNSSLGALFLKRVPREQFPWLEAESRGLAELALTNSVQVPTVVALVRSEHEACLLLTHLDLKPLCATSGRALGRQLAELHRRRAASFGWQHDNFIGASRQSNRNCTDWIGFFSDQRIRFQLDLAAGQPGWSNADDAAVRGLLDRLGTLFADYDPAASLLHGDLWSGNAGALADGSPVIFDPAVYYGDREADLAMCALFGGFPPEFFAAYRAAWPLEPGYVERRDLYQLYHVLNHFNLFGGAYAAQARELTQRLGNTLR